MNNNVSVILKNILETNKKITQAVDNQNDVSSAILSEMMNVANRAERAEMVSILAAEISLEALDEIKKNECFSNAQCALIQKSVQDKATEITNMLYGDLEGEQYIKKWGYVVRGIWTIYKNNVNDGSKAPYSTTLKLKFDAAVEYVNELSLEDYLYHRQGKYKKIKQFLFVSSIEEKGMNIKEMIEERLNSKMENIDQKLIERTVIN